MSASSKSSPCKTVLFICTGNTCRSPMAEGLLRASVQDNPSITVKSAGVSAMSGQFMSPETQEVLKSRGASFDGFRSQQVDEKLLEKSDLVIAMTSSHAEVVRHYFSEDVRLMCDFISEEEGLQGADIPDPIGMGMEAYEEVAEVMELAVLGILKELKK